MLGSPRARFSRSRIFPIQRAMVRTVKAAVACAGAVIMFSACGGQPFSSAVDEAHGRTTGAARVLAAVAHVSDAKTARISMNVRVEGLGAAPAVTVTASGVIDLGARRAAITMRALAGARSTEAEVRVIDGAVWTNSGSGWSSAPAGSADPTGALTTDPTSFLAYLRGVANDVREVGHDTVRGVDTTEYAAKIDLRRAIERADASGATRAQVQFALGLLGNVDLPVNVWIDAQDRVRKFELEMDMSGALKHFGAPSGLHPRMSIIVEFHDFGLPVHVEAPPPTSG